MKTKKFNKKLGLSKRTIANLNRKELFEMKVGAMPPPEATFFCTNPQFQPTCFGVCWTDYTCFGDFTCVEPCATLPYC